MKNYQQLLAELIARSVAVSADEIDSWIEIPPQEDMGDFAFPCFRLAKTMKKSPPAIAAELAQELERQKPSWLGEIKPTGPYLNFFLERAEFTAEVLQTVLSETHDYGRSAEGAGKRVLVEYSSPNIAKTFHAGHAFTTLLGHAIANLYEALGYDVVRLNHLGDYGTQFGVLISAWKRWGDEDALARDAIEELTRVYVKFHQELDEHPELQDEGRYYFKRLEDGEAEEVALWQKFRDLSLKEFIRLYDRLGIRFDSFDGESFYSDQMSAVIDLLREKNLLVESNGAQVVMLDDFQLNPCLILKSDGTTIYATRDLAAAYYRDRTYDFYRNIYVVGLPQKNHFAQVFAVLERAGFAKAGQNVHVPFGSVRFAEGHFSTRAGNVIKLEEFLDQSVAKTREIIAANNPDMSSEEIDAAAETVGLAAVEYTYLRNGRERDIMFDWDEMLDFEGDSAPYLLYTYARARSIRRKSGEALAAPETIDFALLQDEDEQSLIRAMYHYPQVIRAAAESYEPSVLLRHIAQLARTFNRYYHHVPILKGEDDALRTARLALIEAVSVVLHNGLSLAGIATIERM